ncbi:hypothetical protein F4776DRAFT_663459 [Hypoxylon sp. NC0597]|nr:hypothetical protein F4776DRAFT_663459 [Hypoxylon sp. NC0597]
MPDEIIFLCDEAKAEAITYTLYAGRAKDINPHQDAVTSGDRKSYGWEIVLLLGLESSAYNNADSLALFALGVDLIDQGYSILLNGSVKGSKDE